MAKALLSKIGDKSWRKIYLKFLLSCRIYNDFYYEKLNFSYSYKPFRDKFMASGGSDSFPLFDLKKYTAMREWYFIGDRRACSPDSSILRNFPEYSSRVDAAHPFFNSNYGYYAYSQGLLDLCAQRLLENPFTRQAMFCINNNEAMSDSSIDKLCTDTVQFFIRDFKLDMHVHMRSSNIIKLLPYDSPCFSDFYQHVYEKVTEFLKSINPGKIYVTAASAHFYEEDFCNAVKENIE
jgi:hypothetical protein